MFDLSCIPLAAISQDTVAILGFVLVLGVLVLILFRGGSRTPPGVIAHDPPRFPADSPYHEAKRRKAAAAATMMHRHSSKDASS